MADSVDYKVALDPAKVESLSRILKQQDPEVLLRSLFELAYHHYVEEEDELIPGKTLKRRTEVLEAQVSDLQTRLSARTGGDKERQSVLCPKCYSKVRYDTISRDYACTNCGWEGPPEETVRRDPPR